MKISQIIAVIITLLIPHSAFSQQHSRDIRSVDFANFTYPAKPIYPDGKKSFRLKDGKYKGRPGIVGAPAPFGLPYPVSLVATAYGDVTSDDKEEAVVVLTESVAGTAIPFYVYIYSMIGNRPKLLWAFAAGDRGDGGLRKVYAENGELIVELYGKNTGIDDIENKELTGACCPKSFTRIRYRWRGRKFKQKGGSEILSNPLSNAELLMP